MDTRTSADDVSRRVRHGALLPLLLAVVLGAFAGVGGYTFRYAEGLSYFSTVPKACVNCHIMEPQYDAWSKASHHAVAVCVDCHLPQSFVPKYLAKAENGWRHGKLFTTQTFHEPIFVQEPGQRILQANCVRCHSALVDSIRPNNGVAGHATSDLSCVHCHDGVGHGEPTGLGGPLREAELSNAALTKPDRREGP
jgi:cytochrome c nitrite reductase small subunit